MTTDVIDTGVETIRGGLLGEGLLAGAPFAAARTEPWTPGMQVPA